MQYSTYGKVLEMSQSREFTWVTSGRNVTRVNVRQVFRREREKLVVGRELRHSYGSINSGSHFGS